MGWAILFCRNIGGSQGRRIEAEQIKSAYILYTTVAVLTIIRIFVIGSFVQRYIIEGVATQGLKG